MIHCEQDLLANLVVLTSQNARKKFRTDIFKAWDWKCAYCSLELKDNTATLDHIVPKYRGGHNDKSNLCCSCAKCNRSKGSSLLEEWYTPYHVYYCEERLDRLKNWMEQGSYSLKLPYSEKPTHGLYAGCS